MNRTVIGIDLGTTYSLASVLADGKPVVLPNALGELLTPSAVSILEDGSVLVGSAARARATTHPDRTALAFKRDMGTDRTYVIGGKRYSPQQLSALVLKQVAHDAGAVLGRVVDEAVVTVPAYFGDPQRQATRDAAELAGLKVERIINEPTAAALAYGLHERHRELRAVVLDLGGGTFDVTVLQIMEGVVEIQASAGDSRLGGEDFDDALALLALGELDDMTREALRRDSAAWARVKRAAESAKHALSSAESARIAIPALHRGKDLERVLTAAQAEEAWRPLLARLSAPIQRALRDARVSASAVDEILLVGGSTRMPCVGRLAAELLGRVPLRTLPPDEAVALGAAVQAGLKSRDAALGDMVVTDVAPFSLGIATADRSGRSMIAGLFAPIIERGTVIPCSRSQTFWTVEDKQTEIDIEVYQGEHSLVRDNQLLGSYLMKGLKAGPAGHESVEVRFSYDLNGILEVDLTSASGRTASLVIEKTPGRMSKAELAAAREALSRLKFHPRDALPNATALARADAMFMELVGEARARLGVAISELRHALETQDGDRISKARESLEHLMRALR